MNNAVASALVSAAVAAAVVAAYHFTMGSGAGLEKEFHEFRAEVRSAPPAKGGTAAPTFSGDEIAKFRAMTAEARALDAHDRDVETVRRIVQSTGVKLGKDLEDHVCELGAGVYTKLRAAQVQASTGSPEERSAATQKMDVADSEFEADLRALVLPEEAAKILEKFPPKGYKPRAMPSSGPAHPPVPPPVGPAMDR